MGNYGTFSKGKRKRVCAQMRKFFDVFLLIVNVISFVFVLIFGAFGLYEQIMGPADAEKLLKKFRPSWTYNCVLIIGFVCVAIMIISYIVRKTLC